MPAAGWYAWGNNNYAVLPAVGTTGGWLGTGAYTDIPQTPTPMLLPLHASSVTSGIDHSAAVVDGALYVWGIGPDGELGFTPTPTISTGTHTPTTPPGMTSGVAQVACGDNHTAVLKTDGTLWFTGTNEEGVFGNGSFTTTPAYAFVQTMGAPANIAKMVSTDFTLALLDSAGKVWMSGNRRECRIPDGNNNELSPVRRYTTFYECTLINPVQDVSIGWRNSLFLKADGTVWVCGEKNHGQFGDGTNENIFNNNRGTPQQVPGVSDIIDIRAAFSTNYALKSDGTLYTWGSNEYGEAGLGHTDPVTTATPFPMPVGVTVARLGTHQFDSLSTLVIGSDHKVYGAGFNAFGIICRASEVTAPPIHGYPEFDPAGGLAVLEVHSVDENGAWLLYAPPAVAIPGRLATIVG